MRLLLTLFGVLCAATVFSQNSSNITGKVVDESGEPLPMASVVLLQAKDSVMQSFTITSTNGAFELKNVAKGSYVLQAGFVGFQTLSEPLDIDGVESVDKGTLTLKEQTEILEGVQITADRIPILFKGDTIQYNADAFKTGPNATVEDLLRKLPGIEIDQNGNIKAQGEKVNKILVDGKEFFGEDPKIATKNLPSDALKNVQVFDKMSENSEFTGIDDGQRSKTINLSLKDDKKKGVFGKLSIGYGTDERHNSKASINKFNNKSQLSFLGGINNINEQNFSFEDYINFSGGISSLMSGDGEISIESADGGLLQGNQGVSTSSAAGINFNHEFSDKTELSSSYFFSGIDNDLRSIRTRNNFQETGAFTSYDSIDNHSEEYNHRLNLKLEHTISEGQDIKWDASLNTNRGMNNGSQLSGAFLDSNTPINRSSFNNTSDFDALRWNTGVLYRKKLHENGRNLSAGIKIGSSLANDDRLIRTNTSLFDNSSETNEQTNQLQQTENEQLDYDLNFTFSEPLGKKKYVTFNYNRKNFDTDNTSLFFDRDNSNQLVFNSLLSNSYNRDFYYDRFGLSLLISSEKTTFTIGNNVQTSVLKGDLASDNLTIKKDFLNYLPSLSMRHEFDNSKSLRINYTTSVNQPTVNQLSPIVNNTDPVRTYAGNPDLKTEYIHDASIGFNLFDNFSFTNFFSRISSRLTTDKITNGVLFDDNLRQVITPTNINEDWLLDAYLSFGTSIKPLGVKFHTAYNSTFNKTQLFNNGSKNDVERLNHAFDLRVENRKKNAVDVQTGYKIEWNTTQFRGVSELNQNYKRHITYTDLTIDFLKTWKLTSSFDYMIYEGDAFTSDLEFPLLRASISKNFLKNKRGELSLSVFDILDRNTGIQRNSSFNFVEDSRQNTVSRFVMLSFTYSLSAFGDKSGIVIKEGGGR
ncbi:MAG: TonB-dependent receptor [Fulvivirga sp.]|uniref:TonB-dependent receptor n=1 Tax=Fulvivirga sp. TaxID=1931237 RepID=UPI0032EF6771